MADLSVFGKIRTKQDYDRARQEFDMQKQLIELKKQGMMTGADDPASIREWRAFSAMPKDQQEQYLRMKRADQIMNLGGTMGVRNPIGGGIIESYEVTPKITEMPDFQASQEAAKRQADIAAQLGGRQGTIADVEALKAAAEKKATMQEEAKGKALENIKSAEKAMPFIESLKKWNEESQSMAYPELTQPFRRIVPGTSKAEAAVDLMRQTRLELAAPLAKQLGVNPTDKDFQASLDRIFDLSASRESRAQQIKALEDNLKSKMAVDRSIYEGNAGQEQPPLSPGAATPAPQQGATVLMINPQTGEVLPALAEDVQEALDDGWKRLK